jgi:hypothetical protein
MRSFIALGATTAALTAGLVSAAPSLESRHVGDTATGSLQVNYPNGTRAGCLDKSFNWVTNDNACDRFRVVMGRYDGETGEKPFRMTNSEGWGCFGVPSTWMLKCKEGIAGGWWENREQRVPRDGDQIRGGVYGYGVPGACEASPLESYPKVHEYEMLVKLMWVDTVKGPNIFSSDAPSPTKASRKEAKCTSTSTLTPISTHHTFPTDAPFSVHYPGHLNVIHKGKVAGCLMDDGKWTANRSKCGKFKAGKVCKFLPVLEMHSLAADRSSNGRYVHRPDHQ